MKVAVVLWSSLAVTAATGMVARNRLLVEPDPLLEINSTSLTTYLPTATSAGQGVRPLAVDRGVQIDGTTRRATGRGLAISANPFAESAAPGSRVGGIDLSSGTCEIFDVDLHLPSKGQGWMIGRSYNPRQVDSSGNHLDSAGYQGANWFQTSNPELVLYDADSNTSTKQSGDFIYFIYGADRYLEFKRTASNSENFRATNGGAGVIQHVPNTGSEPGTYVYTDQQGNQLYFFDNEPFGSADAGAAALQFWKIVDPAGNTSYLGDATTASTAITNGYSSGRPMYAYDAYGSAGHRYKYEYTSNRLTKVTAAKLNSGAWSDSTPDCTEVGRVEYDYYTSDADTYGNANDLKLVTITTPLTDSGVSLEQRKYYRYYDFDAGHTTYNSSTNPGQCHQLSMVVGFEGTRSYDYAGDQTFDSSFVGASMSDLLPYAEACFEYEDAPTCRVKKCFFNGDSGATGALDGRYSISYENNSSFTSSAGYDTAWKSRAIVSHSAMAWVTQYFDEVGQPLSRVVTDIDPATTSPTPKLWATYVDRSSAGLVTEVDTPSNVTAYTHSSASFTRSTSAGLVWVYGLVGSGHTTTGYVSDWKFSDAGRSGTAYYKQYRTYDYTTWQVDSGDAASTIVRPVVASSAYYATRVTSSTSNATTTTFTSTWQASSGKNHLVLAEHDVTEPAVSTTNNGSGSANTTSTWWNADGTLGFERTALGYITYHEYTNGQQTKLIQDADTSLTASGEDFNGVTVPSGFSKTGTPLHKKSTFVQDDQGRLDTVTANTYTPKNYYTRLKDQRVATLAFTNRVTGGSTTYYGPVSYVVTNQAGATEASGLIALNGNSTTSALSSLIDETSDDPVAAVAVGSVCRLSTGVFSSAGTLATESRLYTTIPTSLPGSAGTNYDATTTVYDDVARALRVKTPDGTIARSVYDVLGNTTEQWIGTNDDDAAFPGGDTSGTCNMVKTEAYEYDAGSDKGNNYLTQTTEYVEDSTTGQRVTAYTNDAFGRTVLVSNAAAPHALNKYDNCGRLLATGMYSSTSGLAVSSDPTSVSTNRLELDENKFDELSRVRRTIRHKIGSSGSDDDTLVADTWYDADGRVTKHKGETFEKYQYDRLGRRTHCFTLASTDDSAYADADDVAGDIVLEEQQTTYDSGDARVIMSATIERNHDDVGTGATTGALDTNADNNALKYTAANVKGRIQITAYWNDLLGVTDEVEFGTYGGADFDRNGLSVPARSTDALRTSYVYGDDGTVASVQDPSDGTNHPSRYVRYVYDAAGRISKTIGNWDGTSGATPTDPDVNLTTAYTYANGLLASVANVLPSPQSNQVTSYSYGTTKGTTAGTSRIATGCLLQKVTYPDSTDSTDAVTYAYNAQGERVWHKDPEPSGTTASVVEFDYDVLGRPTHSRVTTLGTNVDGDVRRISFTYDNASRLQLVTQWSSATVGSGVVRNENKYDYDGWGNILTRYQDENSAVGATASVDDYRLTYSYAKAASAGRNTIRLTSIDMSVGTAAAYKTTNYIYASTNSYDSACSRITKVKDGTTVESQFEYLGVDRVVGDIRPVPSIFAKLHSLTTSGSYTGLDRFNRVVSDRWTRDLGGGSYVDFASTDRTYDETSRLVCSQDNVHTGFSVGYSYDHLSRVTGEQDGTLSGNTIQSGTLTRAQTLQHLLQGPRTLDQRDVNADGVYTGANEYNDARGYDAAHKLTQRDPDNNTATTNLTVSYDHAHHLIDDGKDYKYQYNAYGQMTAILNRTTNALIEQRHYDGEGNLIALHYDHNTSSTSNGIPDGVVMNDADAPDDTDDPWYFKAIDDLGHEYGQFHGNDAKPKIVCPIDRGGERSKGGIAPKMGGASGSRHRQKFRDEETGRSVRHSTDRGTYRGVAMGETCPPELHGEVPPPNLGGPAPLRGGREVCPPNLVGDTCPPNLGEDTNPDPMAPAGGTWTNYYLCSDCTGSVVAVIDAGGAMVESRHFTIAGFCILIPGGDVNSDGVTDSTDAATISGWATAYDVRADLNLDGSIGAADASLASSGYFTGGEDVISSCGVLVGYCGASADPALGAQLLNLPGCAAYSPVLGKVLGPQTPDDGKDKKPAAAAAKKKANEGKGKNSKKVGKKLQKLIVAIAVLWEEIPDYVKELGWGGDFKEFCEEVAWELCFGSADGKAGSARALGIDLASQLHGEDRYGDPLSRAFIDAVVGSESGMNALGGVIEGARKLSAVVHSGRGSNWDGDLLGHALVLGGQVAEGGWETFSSVVNNGTFTWEVDAIEDSMVSLAGPWVEGLIDLVGSGLEHGLDHAAIRAMVEEFDNGSIQYYTVSGTTYDNIDWQQRLVNPSNWASIVKYTQLRGFSNF